MGNHRKCKGDTLWRRLGTVFDGSNPGVLFAQEAVAGEKGAGVAVGSATEQKEVEDGQAYGVARGKRVDKHLLIGIGDIGGITSDEVLVDRVDSRLGGVRGKLVEKLGLEESVIGVFMVKRNNTLVGKENLPFVPCDGIGRPRRRG